MDPVLTLLGLSLAMLVGCYLAGVIPLAVTLSEEKLKLVTVLGAGLLVGTALAVIIPEGVHALGTHSHHAEQLSVRSIDKPAIPGQPAPGEKMEKLTEKQQEKNEETVMHQHEHSENDGHSVIGVALVTGFIFMLLVDQIGGSHMKSSTDTSQLSIQNRNKLTATVGLVVHAAADGIALGAAITLAQTHLTLIVFIAIMLHKAPAAFGLVSFLLHEGFDRPRIRKHLLIFSLAAPVLAILTYMALSQQSRETLSNMNTTGIAMLFSAGTFLYVATVHVLPEISTGQSKVTSLDGTVVLHEHKGFRSIELIALVIGAVIPVILAAGHKH